MSEAHLQITPTPIVVPSHQTSNYNTNGFNNTSQFANFQGADILTHLRLNLQAGINKEWCSKTILQLSNNAPYLVKHQWVLEYLINDIHTNLDKNSALSLRNLSQDSDFTQLLALYPRTKKILSSILIHYVSSDNENIFSDKELLIYLIDIAESISSYLAPAPKDDELFTILTEIFLQNNDRSLAISIMRSFARFLVRSELSSENCSTNFNTAIFDKIVSYLLVDDYDLVLTSLDFLYQYSSPGNIRISTLLKSSTRQEILKLKLPELLTYQLNIKNNPNDFDGLTPLRLVKRTKSPIPEHPPRLPLELYKEIVSFSEPNRATSWMRCSYRAVHEGEVTQISLWKAYEQQFENEVLQNKKKLLPAVDFIKNVSNAFPNSSAMVINLPNGQRKFIIKGIEPRFTTVDVKAGDYEAFHEIKSANESNLKHLPSQQEPSIPYIPPTNLNDVNKSSALLVTSLANHELGKEVFKPVEEEIFKKIEAVPLLFDELADALKYLQ